jgi:hypothetical protein
MKLWKVVFGGFLLVALTILISIPAAQLKTSFLGPMVLSCPNVFYYFTSIFSNPFSNPPIQAIWDCGIGIGLYLALPGIGLSWFITKHVL